MATACSFLYTAKLPNHLASKTEFKDLTKLGQRFNVEPIKNLVKLFNEDQFDDDDDDDDDVVSGADVRRSVNDESVDRGGFVDYPSTEVAEEVVSASATQNLDFLLDALAANDATQSQTALTAANDVEARDDEVATDDDDDWNEMCNFLTQKRLDTRAISFREVLTRFCFAPLSLMHRSYICVLITDGTARIFTAIPLITSPETSHLFPGLLQAIGRERVHVAGGTREDRSTNYFSELKKSFVISFCKPRTSV